MALIEVTEPAAERIRALLDKDGKLATHRLRMKVVGGGCSGLRYELAFDDRMGERDHEIEAGGVRIVVESSGDDRAAATGTGERYARHLR